ncbi:sodium:solute symporter [Haloprofundus marisrubri]|uniref:Sodium:solute symporter n=1 Tax=Haloprofundus marisrubri TaxID=1514971 RepID=A0A0W1R9G2_9EURY|nr:DUF4212 domain-containing protein [Haloprofundus marisrubri]KTG09856.1 sodium:solute symporter [Haloprofundus marisrubri]
MVEKNTQDSSVETDGGTATQAARSHRETNYLDREVNLLRPSTPFMREHLRVVWTGFIVWAVVVFGPVTATFLAPGLMTTQMPVLGFPLHYFLVAIGAPMGALLLSFWYARKRDALDRKYGIDHAAATSGGDSDSAVAADGGTRE